MAFGISVYNTDNFLTISETYANYCLISTGTGNNSTTSPLTGNQLAFFYPLSGATMAVALPGYSGYPTSTNGAQWVWTSNNAGFEYAIVQPTLPTPTGVGIAVYNSSGTAQFDSNRRPVVPIYQYRRSGAYTSGWAVTPTLPAVSISGKKRYVTLGKLTGFFRPGAIGPSFWTGTITSFSSVTTPTLTEGTVGTGAPPGTSTFGTDKYWLFVDI